MSGFGIDPSTGQPQPVQQQDPQVDPGSAPADPMLAGPGSGDSTAQEDAAEFQTRERVELQLLLAIEACAKAAMVGEGASNQAFVQAYGQACQAMALAYSSLATIEQKEAAPPPNPQQGNFFGNAGAPSPQQDVAA